MTRTALCLFLFATVSLTACDSGTGAPPGTAGMSPVNAAQASCLASTSIESLLVMSEITITQVRPTDTGYSIDLVVSNERDPYTCVTDAAGNVQSVTFTGPGRPRA